MGVLSARGGSARQSVVGLQAGFVLLSYCHQWLYMHPVDSVPSLSLLKTCLSHHRLCKAIAVCVAGDVLWL